MSIKNRSAELRDGASAGHLALAFESFVSAGVEEIAARRRQAQLIGSLTLSGFLAAALSPLAVFAGWPLGYSFLPLVAGAALLAGAGATAATGAPRLVLIGLALLTAAVLAVVAPLASAVFASGAALVALSQMRAPRVSRPAVVPTIEAVPLSALVLDASGRVRSVGERVAGFGLEIGGQFVEKLPVQERLAFLTAFDAVRAGAPAASCRVQLMSAVDSSPVTLDLAITRSTDGGVAIDLTQTETLAPQADPTLAEALSAAQAASEAKSRLLAAVSHELRTPLNAIIGFTDVLDQEIFGSFANERQREYVRLIQSSGAHLLHVVNGLLDIAKIEAGRYELQPESFDVEQAIRAAAEMVRCEADRKGLRIDVRRVPRDATTFRADPRAFQQMLLNLLSNAVKFTASGTVTVMARVEDGQQVLIVADTGVGIAEADLGRLAQPFVQLSTSGDADGRGTGLGLSLVKGLCDVHGGEMSIASRRGQGTTVSLRLPIELPGQGAGTDNPNEKIVALKNARRKSTPSPQGSPERRTA